jgi:hypothetical protein
MSIGSEEELVALQRIGRTVAQYEHTLVITSGAPIEVTAT